MNNRLCEQAMFYFHELALSDEPNIPQEIFRHIENCPACQKQIDVFKQIFGPSQNEYERDEAVTLMTELLTLHFSFNTTQVSCRQVKQFLPTMAIPQLEIRIPTPITVHTDKCDCCTKDLATIRSLNLDRKQLYRFSEFLTDKKHCCSSADHKRKKAAQIVAALDWEIVDAGTLKHLCKCPTCSEHLYQQRQRILENLSVCSRQIPCDAIFTGGFFDYVLPYGIDPSKDEYARLREPFVTHIIKCPDCLAKMQQLHRTIYEIENRPDSGIVTVFEQDARRKNKFVPGADNLYQGFPVKVDTYKKTSAPAVVNLQKAKSSFGLKLKVGMAAAIFLIVGISLFFHNTATADPTPADKMYQALQGVANIHVSQYAAGNNTPISQQWRSKTFKIFRIKNNQSNTLYNLSLKNVTTTSFDTGKTEIMSLDKETLDEIKNLLNLRGHKNKFDLNPNIIWNYVSEGATPEDEILCYEAVYETEGTNGFKVYNKRRIYVFRDSFLPVKTEYYDKVPDEDDFTLRTAHIYKYLTDEEFKAALNL